MNKNRFSILLAVICLITASTSLCAQGLIRMGEDDSMPVPEVRLISPTKEVVDLTGKEALEFKWSPHEDARGFRQYYDFRLYKGREILESTLIFKKKVEPRESSYSLPADMFEEGGIYTWSMRQVYDGSRKSPRSYHAFSVKKM